MKTSVPEDAGMSSRRLERIAPIMLDFVKGNRLPGIMTLLQRRGRIVHFGAFGLADIEAGRPIAEDALFRIYSMTKPITSVALMMLVEEGRLGLTDPVATFIPAFGKMKVCIGSGALGLTLVDQKPPMTLYHLITHTAGLSYGWFFDSPVEELYRKAIENPVPRSRTLQELVDRIAEIPLLYQPGTSWRYSVATDVLGQVIQVAADMPLSDFFEERIFKPLGMSDTGFVVPPQKAARLAQIYASPALYDPKPFPSEGVFFIGDVTKPTRCPFGGAGLVSTLSDYLAFCNCLLSNGAYDGGRLLSRKTVAWMTANHIPDRLLPLTFGPDELHHGFGLGFGVVTHLGGARYLTSTGEYGWGGAAQTCFWIDPAEELIGLMMTQHLPAAPYPVIERFRNLAYQAISD
jgi:CubicO group peptidase (beta-lactamase class C family)